MYETHIQLPLEHIPLDKSWMIRMGVLDIIRGEDFTRPVLNEEYDLGDDLVALREAIGTWDTDEIIPVGESGTLLRFLVYTSLKQGLGKEFQTKGTLGSRPITDDPDIINLSQGELLKIDNGTSQWASAAVLNGDEERLQDPPYKLDLTYEAVEYRSMIPFEERGVKRYDDTIIGQAAAFIALLNRNKKPQFEPKQAEDYCFARTFGYIGEEEGEERWPSLKGHESDRIAEMSAMLEKAESGMVVDSKDHRVVQAIGMKSLVENKGVKIAYPDAVNKSWPQFWDFIRYSENNLRQ